MIQDVGNIELCELLETEPQTQCTACLSYWNIGIVYCTCGHFLQKETAVNRKIVKCTMDLLSLPEYVIMFRIRMIEHHRDEEVCRRWDALADEDHTHHLTEQEYFYYKNKWWLHSNKQGSNTIPLRNRSDFKQALSTLERLQQEAGEEPYVPTYSNKHKQWQLAQSSSSTWWN